MRRLLVVAAVLVAAASASAQQQTVGVTKLILRPTPAPTPILKYQLLPDTTDLEPGNAAYLYQRAHAPEWITNLRRDPEYAKLSDYLNKPFKDLPREKWGMLLTSKMLQEVDRAARRQYCDWELEPRIKEDGVGLLLPDIQGFREFATLLALRARFQMADGKFEDAVRSLQTGLAMGRHVGDAPTLISALVGIAISMVQLNQLEDLIQTPGSPNLYWALTELPTSFVDLRRPIGGERLWLFASLPELRDIETSLPWSAQQQAAFLQKLIYLRRVIAGDGRPTAEDAKKEVEQAIEKTYPQAKAALLATGRKPEEVEALPPIQVASIQFLHVYREMQDDLFRWYNVPFPRGMRGMLDTQERIKKIEEQPAALIFKGLLPASHKVLNAKARLDRRFAALRVIEAIRLYAASHNGKLPATLADITDVPIPLDPMTGKEFQYKAKDNIANLFAPMPTGIEPNVGNVLNYELTLER